jgi:iron(III) transport system permease protein
VLIILPLLALIRTSLARNAYGEGLARTADSLVRSIEYALLGASALVVIGFLTGYLIHTRSFRGWLAVDSLTVFLFALPSTVIGVGLISLWNRPSTSFIYATPAILLIGYLAQYAALPSRITVSTLGLIPPSMEEAGQVAGATWFRRLTGIIAPLAARGLIVAWVVSYVFCLRDTGISMMVYPPGQDTLPVRIFTLMANSPPEAVAAACVMMMLATLVPLGVLGFILRTARRQA